VGLAESNLQKSIDTVLRMPKIVELEGDSRITLGTLLIEDREIELEKWIYCHAVLVDFTSTHTMGVV